VSITIPTDAYCQLSDLTRYLPQRTFSATSKPTSTDAESLIKEVAAEINAVLSGLGITTPVTTSSALPVLKRINAMGAAEDLEAAARAGVTAPIPGEGKNFATEWGPKYDRIVEDMKEGKFALPGVDQPETQTGGLVDSMRSSGDYPDPVFAMDDEY
jgi:hypothetical protein